MIWDRNSGVSWCLWTATACWTAASINSFSLSAEIAIVQFISLGNKRQSMYLRAMAGSLRGANARDASIGPSIGRFKTAGDSARPAPFLTGV